jgi:glutathione S-transferase
MRFTAPSGLTRFSSRRFSSLASSILLLTAASCNRSKQYLCFCEAFSTSAAVSRNISSFRSAGQLGSCQTSSSVSAASSGLSRLQMTRTSSTSAGSQVVMSWKELQHLANEESDVGKALTKDQALRESGYGEAHVSNTLRLFDKPADFQPKLTLYRDKAGWCPYCEKAMLLVEEKRIPIHIVTVNMRSYGDKPQEFLRMVPNGLLPALMVENDAGQKRVMTESQVIMEYLDAMHPVEEGYKRMVPAENDTQGQARYRYLAQLERQLFGAWCQLTFRPEGGMVGGLMSGLMGTGGGDKMSGAMKQFMQVVDEVDRSLLETSGPWFFESQSLMGDEGPSMIDFIYISHVERMLASCSHWKGLDMRSDKYRQKWKGLNAWLDAFELRPSYLGFKSDYYTTVMVRTV